MWDKGLQLPAEHAGTPSRVPPPCADAIRLPAHFMAAKKTSGFKGLRG